MEVQAAALLRLGTERRRPLAPSRKRRWKVGSWPAWAQGRMRSMVAASMPMTRPRGWFWLGASLLIASLNVAEPPQPLFDDRFVLPAVALRGGVSRDGLGLLHGVRGDVIGVQALQNDGA